MFETILNLVSYAFFAIVVFVFAYSIIQCIIYLIRGDGWKRFRAILAAGLGVFVFFKVQDWMDSAVLSMFATSALMCFVMGCLPEDTNKKQRSSQGAQDQSVKTGPGTHTYVGSSVSYGSHTQYSGGNSGNRYGNSTYYSDGDVGNRYGEVVYFKSGGHSVDNGDVMYYYDKNGRETGKCIRNGSSCSYYGDCGPHTKKR